MAFASSSWKCWYIKEADRKLCPSTAHIVGLIPHLSMLEVAVPIQAPFTKPYINVTQVPPVSIKDLVTLRRKDEVGYMRAYAEMCYNFLRDARQGIQCHGASLGDYYLGRYPEFSTCIEYAILLQDLPTVSLAPHASAKEEQYRDEFGRAALFLSFGAMQPFEPISQELRGKEPWQIVARVRESLEERFRNFHGNPPRDLRIISQVRHVLVRIRGHGSQPQLPGPQLENIDLSMTFRSLLGGDESKREGTQFDLLFQQVSTAQAFSEFSVDQRLIQEIADRLSLEPSLLIRHLPSSWGTHLSFQQKTSFRALVEEASALCETSKNPYNTKNLFVIWTYTHSSDATGCREKIEPQSSQLFTGAAQHLTKANSRVQAVLNVMTLFCLTKLFSKPEISIKKLNTLDSLDAILNMGNVEDSAVALKHCLASLYRVLINPSFPVRHLRLADFIQQFGSPHLSEAIQDDQTDFYWSCRLLYRLPHSDALEKVRLSTRPAPSLLSEGELVEECIKVNVDARAVENRRISSPAMPENEMTLRRVASGALMMEARDDADQNPGS
ncbi:alphan-acetylglucosamine transferase [Fusarium coicis]|nr:alphan-acetylglucosamine transferase [Fusarium coicis]